MADKLMSQRTKIVQTNGAKEALKGVTKASVMGSTSGSVGGDDIAGDDDAASIIAEDSKSKGKKPSTSTPTTKGRRKRAPLAKEKPKVNVVVDNFNEPAKIPIPDLDDDDQIFDAFVKREFSRP